MKLCLDTNVLVRALVQDDARQAAKAAALIHSASSVVITLPVACELAWVLRSVYGMSNENIATTFHTFVNAANIDINRLAVAAGLEMLALGGDFADGVIEHEGRWQGAEGFATFDKKAAKLLKSKGQHVELL